MKRIIGAVLCLTIAQSAYPAVRGDNAMYVGGTVTTLKEGSQGDLDLNSKTEMRLVTKDGTFTLPYKDITSLEAGLKSGYRVGLTVALAATTMGLAALPVLLAKKKKHYLTINYLEDGQNTGVIVLELAKGIERSATAVISARSGKKMSIQGTAPNHEPLIAKIDHTPLSSGRTTEVTMPIEVAVTTPAPKPSPRETQPGEFRPKIFGLE